MSRSIVFSAVALLAAYSFRDRILPQRRPFAIEDPACEAGLSAGWEIVTGAYDVPPEKFIEKMGSFFDYEWCSSFSPERKTGTNNVPGAARVFSYFGGEFPEYLIHFSKSEKTFEMAWRMQGPEYITNAPVKPNGTLTIGGYTEALRLQSVCGGTATQIEFTGRYCTDDLVATFGIMRGVHGHGVRNVTAELSAKEIDGKFDCPKGL
ncbi:hypothetical protein GYMLUDRAFT_232867 [Collybiopsis luxurians FD-317 M1]|uniref:Uncharacterized protein n=1 Tax=Collybiopsis luxurians FD-317 M1 TaxID=944289 RepID=A0A0D0BUH4_9AGAR|nr:hypothetical protein GYMLUDRAFT_232867 [Collybiopsis luxurians FD-317 M1]